MPETDATQNGEVTNRKPVWSALSNLFLDTVLGDQDIERLATQLATSPYGVEKIEEILRFEVTPVLKWNLRMIAGEWNGFDEERLYKSILPGLNRRPWIRMPVLRAIRADWKRVKGRIAELRSEGRPDLLR